MPSRTPAAAPSRAVLRSARARRPWCRCAAVSSRSCRHHASRGQSSRAVRLHDAVVQPAAGYVLERRHAGGESSHTGYPHADLDPRHVRRHRRYVPAIALERAAAHRGGVARGLHRARRALRELRASDHHHLDLTLGGRRCGARAHGMAHRVQHHRADRRDPAHRHREEERHHDDRLRHPRRAHVGADSRARPSTRRACCAFGRS